MSVNNSVSENFICKVEKINEDDWKINEDLESGYDDQNHCLDHSVNIEKIKTTKMKNSMVPEEIAHFPGVTLKYSNDVAKKENEDVNYTKTEVSNVIINSFCNNGKEHDICKKQNLSHNYNHNSIGNNISNKIKINYQASVSKKETPMLKNWRPVVLLERITIPKRTVEPAAVAIESFEKVLERVKLESDYKNLITNLKQKDENFPDIEITAKPSIISKPKIYRENEQYNCNVCSSKFRNKSYFNKHMHTHTEEKSYTCKVPSSKIRDKITSKQHTEIRTENKKKRFSCNVCSSKFYHKGHLNRHKRIHTNEKPYSCEVCPSKFREKGQLIVHKRSHTKEKPYTCNICSGKFRTKSILKDHMAIHMGEKPFTCDICSTNFRRKHHLIHHMRTHTGEKPYVCDVCFVKFSEKCSLTRHKRRHV